MSPLNFARAVITSSFKKKGQRSKITATGGTTSTPGNGYRIHTFISPGTFTIASGYDDVEYLIVGGGGGGESGDNAGSSGGGAGAGGGGVLQGKILLSGGNYPLVVGSGGGGGNASNGATPGTDSNSLTEGGIYHERSGGVNIVFTYTGQISATHTNTFDYNITFNTPYNDSSYSVTASNVSSDQNITANGTVVPAGFYSVVDNKSSSGFRLRWFRNDDNSAVNVRYHTVSCVGSRTITTYFRVSGNFGDPSSFYGISAGGGGFGGSGSSPSGARKSGTPQENLGGTTSPGTQQPGAGGGGAGAAGVPDAVQSPGGNTASGGIGITTNFSGVSVVYGSGGGGGRGDGSPSWPATFGRGGTGAGNGGDTGSAGGNATGVGGAGGGGGVGSSPSVSGGNGGNGAAGIVILRYLL